MELKATAIVLIGLSLSACGQIGYKTGAGSDAFNAASSDCQANAGAANAYKACMNKQGWALADLSPDAAPAAETNLPPTAPLAPPPAGQSSPEPTPVAVAAPPQNMMVQSWWKIGGNNGDLKATIADCIATSSDMTPPATPQGPFTPALMRCLNGKGWHGFGRAAS